MSLLKSQYIPKPQYTQSQNTNTAYNSGDGTYAIERKQICISQECNGGGYQEQSSRKNAEG
jgi:hypothetical protein